MEQTVTVTVSPNASGTVPALPEVIPVPIPEVIPVPVPIPDPVPTEPTLSERMSRLETLTLSNEQISKRLQTIEASLATLTVLIENLGAMMEEEFFPTEPENPTPENPENPNADVILGTASVQSIEVKQLSKEAKSQSSGRGPVLGLLLGP